MWEVEAELGAAEPASFLLLYGQKLAGWSEWAPPAPLRAGQVYHIYMRSGGRTGETIFVAGRLLPCPS